MLDAATNIIKNTITTNKVAARKQFATNIFVTINYLQDFKIVANENIKPICCKSFGDQINLLPPANLS